MVKRFFDFELPVIESLLKKYREHVLFIMKHFCWLITKNVGFKNLTLKTKQGIFIVSTKDNAIGRSLYTKGQFEYDFSRKAVDLLRTHGYVKAENITLFDIGANIGIIGVGLLRSGMIAQACAVEPEKYNYELLRKNIKLNGLEAKILCLPFALGDSRTVLKMKISQTNLGDHRIQGATALPDESASSASEVEIEHVESIPLDELIRLPEVAEKNWSVDNAILWTDVQGYEGYVFKGARAFLSKGVPTVSEIWPEGIRSAGMSLEAFTAIVQSQWSDYWVLRGERFIRYPIVMFDRYLEEIEYGDGNVIFTPPPPIT